MLDAAAAPALGTPSSAGAGAPDATRTPCAPDGDRASLIRVARAAVRRLLARGSDDSAADSLLAAASLHDAMAHEPDLRQLAEAVGIPEEMAATLLRADPAALDDAMAGGCR